MDKPLRCITINTDASFCHKNKVGGYAFYIICDRFKIQKGGMFKETVQSPLDAEMMCIANAIHTLSVQPNLPEVALIVINTDCTAAIERIGLKSKNDIGRVAANKLKKVRNLMSRNGVILPEFEFRHVKAHSGVKDARSWVNEWCDSEAKKWMRRARKKETTTPQTEF